MPPSIPNPLDALGALRALGELSNIAENTAAMREHTAVLVDVLDGIERLNGDTRVLPTMEDRMATIEGTMPVLVEVQQHLARLPETIERLDARIDQMSGSLDNLLESLGKLSVSIEKLQEGVEPLGRFAKRLPGQPKNDH